MLSCALKASYFKIQAIGEYFLTSKSSLCSLTSELPQNLISISCLNLNALQTICMTFQAGDKKAYQRGASVCCLVCICCVHASISRHCEHQAIPPLWQKAMWTQTSPWATHCRVDRDDPDNTYICAGGLAPDWPTQAYHTTRKLKNAMLQWLCSLAL